MLVMPFFCEAQFGYLGGGVGFRTTTFYKEPEIFGEKTKYVPLTLEVSGMYRPLRFLGVGATVSFPVYQSSEYSLGNTEGSGGYRFEGFGTSAYGSLAYPEFIPQKFEYTFEQSIAFTLKARLYAVQTAGIYFDIRFTTLSLTETFIMERASRDPTVQENYNNTENIRLFMPGLAMGIQNHISQKIYIDFSANFDFMNVRNVGFAHTVSYKNSGSVKYVTFKDQVGGKHSSFGLQLSLGYVF